jgi:hypothetical protein
MRRDRCLDAPGSRLGILRTMLRNRATASTKKDAVVKYVWSPAGQRSNGLTAIYVSDRAGNTSAATLSLAMVTSALAYMIAVAAYMLPKMEHRESAHKVPVAVLCTVPLPVVGLFGFFMIMWADTKLRGRVLATIERHLAAEFSLTHATLPGSHRRTDAVNRFSRQTWQFGVTFATTALVCPTVVLATIIGVDAIAIRGGPHEVLSWVCLGGCTIFYSFTAIAAAVCFRVPSESLIEQMGLPSVGEEESGRAAFRGWLRAALRRLRLGMLLPRQTKLK